MKSLLSQWLSLAACILLLSGCGGAGSMQNIQTTLSTSSRAGRVSITVQWPPRGRLIPVASNSITVVLMQGGASISSQLLARPALGGTSSVSFTNLAPGGYSMSAIAFPNADGSGVAQARGASSVTVTAGQTTPVTVNMLSTISTLSLTPNAFALGAGQTYALTATAKDSLGDIVLLTPGKLNWNTNNSAVAKVDTSGNVSGVTTGPATITVTDTESGKTAMATINVVQPVSWWKAEGNALDAEGNNNGVVSGGVTYGPGEVGQGFVFNDVDGVVNLGDPPDLAFTGSFTIDCWVETNAIPSQSQLWDNIFFRGDDRDGLDPYFLAIYPDGNYVFQIAADGTNVLWLKAPVQLGVLQHLTCTLDGNTGDMRLYVNSQLMAESTTTIRPLQNLQQGIPGGVAIGNSSGAPASKFHYPHNGIIDEVKVYNAVVPPLP